jgi:hypothetical protein
MAVLSVRAAPDWNPSAGNQSSVALVVTVNQPGTGDPVTGLGDKDFTVFVSSGPVNPEQSVEINLQSFAEHPAGGAEGAYALGLGHGPSQDWGPTPPIFIIDVRSGADRGRAMTTIRF